MHKRIVWCQFVLLAGLVAASCNARRPNTAAVPSVVAAAATATSTAPTSTSRATPTLLTPTRTLPATPSATPAPTATELPTLLLAVPPAWRLEAFDAASAIGETQRWQIVVSNDPEQLLRDEQAHAALLPDDAGFEIGIRPLALTVPFSHEWDDLTLPEALEIVENGHQFVTVLPWAELTPERRALRVEGLHLSDAGYPFQQTWSMHGPSQYAQGMQALADQMRLSSPSGPVNLAAVGDIMLDRALGEAIDRGDTGFPFVFVAQFLQQADYTVGNLESALGDTGVAANKSYTFIAPPAAARSLAQSGFDLVSLANNHAMDFGSDALLQGIGLLGAEGIATVGAGADREKAYSAHVAEVNGLRFGFLGYVNVPVEGRAPYFDTASWTAGEAAPGLAWADPDTVASDVAELRPSVDHVIVILHSGYEYVPSPSPEQAAAARAAVDAGATLVIGHHAHILQGVEFRGEGAIVYGLANFAFNITGPSQTAILNAWFDEEGLRQLNFIPVIVEGSGQPVPATSDEEVSIRRQIYALSRSFN